jgi:hypothetical protein
MSGLGKWFAVSCDGQMTAQEMLSELQKDKVCPVMCYEENGENIVPLFSNARIAEKFTRRNTPRNWTVGTMEAHQDNIDQLEKNGYRVEETDWPKKRKVSVAILHMDGQTVETENNGFRKTRV